MLYTSSKNKKIKQTATKKKLISGHSFVLEY